MKMNNLIVIRSRIKILLSEKDRKNIFVIKMKYTAK